MVERRPSHCIATAPLSTQTRAESVMSIDNEGARLSSAEEREVERQAPSATPKDRGRSRTGVVLGSLVALLVLAGAVYYFGAHRAGTDVATGSNSPPSTESS